MLQEGSSFQEVFRFSQEEVERFAVLTGDDNPLHLDEQYAAGTPFKRPIMHGMLSATVFSKILGTKFPGEGTIYLKQDLAFLRPMYVNTDYEARLTVKNGPSSKGEVSISTIIKDKTTGKTTISGEATVKVAV